jgi:5'-deoxynucleotidase
MASFSFFALISRMKNIGRWSLMRNSSQENVQEHSHMVAVVAHALAVIRRDVFGREAHPGKAAAAGLYHDASEIFTGDMPTPVKYYNDDIITAYKKVESLASKKLLTTLPEAMRPSFEELFSLDPDTAALIKAADKLCAYIKCLEELKTGNSEFKSAAAQTLSKLKAMSLPEVDYFMVHFLGAFELTLDELDFSV